MIISRTPFRISFVGGGSDFREFYREDAGAVVSATIDKYVFLSMHPLFNSRGYHLKYFKNEMTENIDRIKHPIIREVFKRYLITGVDFNSSSDIPSGTGLGSSSSFTVGLLNLCNKYNQTVRLTKYELAEIACNIEIDCLKAPIGVQDQYAASFGGMNFIQFTDQSVTVEKIRLSDEKKKILNDSLMLFYLGSVRKAETVLEDQQKNMADNRPGLRKMVKLAEDLRTELNNDSIDHFGEILDTGWHYKKELCKSISNGAVDFWYNKAKENGATGGKLLGAGSTGFMLLYVQGDKNIIRANMDLYELKFKFDDSGTSIIYQ